MIFRGATERRQTRENETWVRPWHPEAGPSTSFDCDEILWAIDPVRFDALMQMELAEPMEREVAGNQHLETGRIAVVDLLGPLTKAPSVLTRWYGGTAMNEAREQVDAAAANDSITGILLRIDSPGGTVAGTKELADAVFAARQQKPVHAWGQDLVASAAYWVGSQADKLWMNTETAEAGSIGTMMVVGDFSGALERYGIKAHLVKSGRFKGAGAFGTKVTGDHLSMWQRQINGLNEVFLEGVSRGRGMSMAQVRRLADGSVSTTRAALRSRMIDGVRSLSSVVSDLSAAGAARRGVVALTPPDRMLPMFNRHQMGLMVSWGLPAEAGPEEAATYFQQLPPDRQQLVQQLGGAEVPEQQAPETVPPAASEPAPAPAPQPDMAEARAAWAREEMNRQRSIRGLCEEWGGRGYQMTDIQTAMIEDPSCSVDIARSRILDHIAGQQQRPQAEPGLEVGESGSRRFAQIADQAFLLAGGVETDYVYTEGAHGSYTLTRDPEAARRARAEAEREGVLGMGLQAIARECISQAGQVRNVNRLSPPELFNALAATGFGMSSGDFPLILEAASRKSLVAAYEMANTTYRTICQEISVRDFNEHKLLKLSESPLLKKRLEGAPAARGTYGEERERHSVNEYALAIGLTRQMVVNDDLGAFTRISSDMGQAIADTIENEVWDVVLFNSGVGPLMEDGVALWSVATHANLAGAGAAPSDTTIKAGITGFVNQTGFGQDAASRPLGLLPSWFLGNQDNVWDANVVLRARFADGAGDEEAPQQTELSSMRTLHVPQLTIRSENDWYLWGPKNRAPIAVSYLNGNRTPRTRRVDGTTISGLMWLVEFDMGVDAVEWRTGWRNPGA